MTYPVYIGDRAAGTMTVTAAGEDHLFEVICHPPEPGLWRVWVQGEGQRLALGLLEGGRLRRRFSRRITGPLGAIRWAGAESCAARDSPWRPAGPEDCPLPLPDSGANDYLTKPFHSQELLARIRAMDGGLWAEYRFEDGYPVPPEEN